MAAVGVVIEEGSFCINRIVGLDIISSYLAYSQISQVSTAPPFFFLLFFL
jgi:hypothetical protein